MLVMDDIIRKAQDGDVEAIEYIFNKYKSLIWKSVRKSYIKSGDWQDIYQECLIGLWIAIKKYNFDLGVPFAAFASTCVRSSIRDLIMRDNTKKQSALNNAINIIDDNQVKYYQNIEENIVIKEELKELKNVLNESQYKVIILTFIGFRDADIAKKINKTKTSVRKIRYEARKKLKKNNYRQ